MSKHRINLEFQDLVKNLDTEYEILPTEIGKSTKQLIRLYQNCIFLKFNIDVSYYCKDEEDSLIEDSFQINSASTLDKYAISNIVMAEQLVLQCTKDGEDKEYSRITVNIISDASTYTIWCKDDETAVNLYNNLLSWRYGTI